MTQRLDFWEHFEELRRSLVRCLLIIAVGVVSSLLLSRRLIALLTSHLGRDALIVLGPLEGITTSLKVAFWMGFVGTAPLWSWVLCRFIVPALKPSEKRLVVPFLGVSLLLIAIGGCVAHFGTAPVASAVLFRWNASLGLNMWSLSQAVSFSVILILSHAFVFQLFAILLFLIHLGRVSAAALVRQRRVSVVLTFVVAAVVTPPDVMTQVILALALLVLYEGAVLYARSVSFARERRRGLADRTRRASSATDRPR